MTELSSISSGWTRAGFVGSNQTATPSLSLSFTLTHVVLQLLLFHTLSLSPSLLLLPPSTTSSAVAPPLVPTFPPKHQDRRGTNQAARARPTPPPACPRLPHGAPCTLGARVLQRARNSTVCVCVRACVLAGWIPPQRCTEPRTLKWLLGAGQVDGRAAFLSQVASLPPTAHHPHQAVGTCAPPTSWEVFFWKVWRWLPSALTHLRHR